MRDANDPLELGPIEGLLLKYLIIVRFVLRGDNYELKVRSSIVTARFKRSDLNL